MRNETAITAEVITDTPVVQGNDSVFCYLVGQNQFY